MNIFKDANKLVDRAKLKLAEYYFYPFIVNDFELQNFKLFKSIIVINLCIDNVSFDIIYYGNDYNVLINVDKLRKFLHPLKYEFLVSRLYSKCREKIT